MKPLADSHSLRLPEWGPYTKRYIGISHVAEEARGVRFDLSVFPGYYRRRVDVPNVMWESGYHPWEASADLRYFSHRHELEWRDQVYCDVAFSPWAEQARLIRCACVNNTDAPQNLVLHYMASLHFPPAKLYSREILYPGVVALPAAAVWIDAMAYDELAFATPHANDGLAPDGLLRGEFRASDFVDGHGLGQRFGAEAGDRARYTVTLAQPISSAVLLVRYQANEDAAFRLAGLVDAEVRLPAQPSLVLVAVPCGDLAAGTHTLTLTSLGNGAVQLDGFVLVAQADADAVRFSRVEWNPTPEILPGPTPQSLLLKYADADCYYGLAWDFPDAEVRQFLCEELDATMRQTVHNHVTDVLRGEGNGHFTNVFQRPIPIAPHAATTLYGLVCAGTRDEVTAQLREFATARDRYDACYASAHATAVDLAPNPSGKAYAFSQQRMAATTLTNVVYPIYARGYIKHNTPGRWWDCLYTWDSGFVGLGLLELDLTRAVDCLNAYLTAPGDPHAAFMHHGSLVPVQFYLFQEIWNRTADRELLAYVYPRLRQYHQFMAGEYGGSITRNLPSNLLKTWQYFYNSGGWDDYPPQSYVHRTKQAASITPVVTTAHVIRTAKIMRQLAMALGLPDDCAGYDVQIATFTQALQQHAWDEEAGYFSYVVHDTHGQPTGFLRHESGANFNMGLDGVSPLLAGICTQAQQARLRANLMDPQRLWTPIGLSTVDQSAPYYRHNGYWNGAVWMPHQWFMWKTLLTLGHAEEARHIARTGMELWRNEVDTSYNCFEHFIIASGRGAGWHHFGGLSTPVLAWFTAYHRPGHLTVGFDTWVETLNVAPDQHSLTATLTLSGQPGTQTALIATLRPGRTYQASWNGAPIPVRQVADGTLELTLPAHGQGELRIGSHGIT